MRVYMDTEYLMGHLRYGHLEGEVPFNPEEEEDFQNLLRKELKDEPLTDEENDRLENYKEDILSYTHIVVDDYCIEGVGEYCWSDCLD